MWTWSKKLHLSVTVRGVRFEATVNETTQASLSLDFSTQVGSSAKLLQPFLLQAINDQGLHLDEFEQCDAAVRGSSLVVSLGGLSDESLRRVMSLILTDDPERPAQRQAASSARTAASAPDPAARASKRYLETVNRIIDDLEKAGRRATSYSRTATWHDNFAAKIDKLPTADVDPQLLDYGESISSKLRALAASLRGVAVDVNSQQRSVTYNMQVDPGWEAANVWGGYSYRAPSVNVTSNLQEVRERQAQAVAKGAKERLQIWTMIREERSQTMRRLKAQYPDI